MNVLYIDMTNYMVDEDTGEIKEVPVTAKVPVTYNNVSIEELIKVLQKLKERADEMDTIIPTRINHIYNIELD